MDSDDFVDPGDAAIQALLAATEADLAAIADRVARGTLHGAAKISEAIGQVIGKHKAGKHFERTITDTSFSYQRNQAAIDTQAALDGICVLRTSVDADTLTPAAVVESYKNLAHIERDFRPSTAGSPNESAPTC